jgi:hypothetical protein
LAASQRAKRTSSNVTSVAAALFMVPENAGSVP